MATDTKCAQVGHEIIRLATSKNNVCLSLSAHKHLETEYIGKHTAINDQVYLHFFYGGNHDNGYDGNCHDAFHSTFMLIHQ